MWGVAAAQLGQFSPTELAEAAPGGRDEARRGRRRRAAARGEGEAAQRLRAARRTAGGATGPRDVPKQRLIDEARRRREAQGSTSLPK